MLASLKFLERYKTIEVKRTATKVISLSEENVNLKLTVSTKEGTKVKEYTSKKKTD